MERPLPTQKEIIIKFCVRFAVLSGFLYVLLNWLPSAVITGPLNRQTAEMTAVLLRLFGLRPVVNGVFLSAGGFSIKIITECSAIFAAILFFSFVMAYPASARQRALGLLFGIPFLFTANLLRIVFVFLVGMYYLPLFEYAHVYIGQIVMILFVLLSSMTWLSSIAYVRIKDRPLSFFLRFLLYSSLPFLLWLYLDESFVLVNLYVIKSLLGFGGYAVNIPEKLDLYPHTFNTFHLVAFTSLILATNSIGRSKKLKSLGIGLAVLCAFQFLLRLHWVLFFDFHMRYAFRPFVALIIINQWILPFGLWLFIVRKEIFKRKGIYVCPICGEEKVGILDHIKAKHGTRALETTAVKALLKDIGMQ